MSGLLPVDSSELPASFLYEDGVILQSSSQDFAEQTQVAEVELKELDGYTLLKLSGCELPKEVIKINLNGQKFTSIKESELAYFYNLTSIDAAQNYLNVSSFGCFTALRQLNLAENQICELDLTAEASRKLERVNFSFNPIYNIADLCILDRLSELTLAGCQMTTVPWSFIQLTRLQSLDVSFNKITEESGLEMWRVLSHIPTLKTLFLNNNQIRTIQEPKSTLCKLKLVKLDLSNNLLETEFDVSCLIQLSELNTIVLSGNKCIQRRNRISTLFESALGTKVVVSDIKQADRQQREEHARKANYKRVKLEKVKSWSQQSDFTKEMPEIVIDIPAVKTVRTNKNYTGAKLTRKGVVPEHLTEFIKNGEGRFDQSKVALVNSEITTLDAQKENVGTAVFLTEFKKQSISQPLKKQEAIIVSSCKTRNTKRLLFKNEKLMTLAKQFLGDYRPTSAMATPVCFKFLNNYFSR